MITNCEIFWRDGIPPDTVLINIPKSPFTLQCKAWKNGSWNVHLIKLETNFKKEVWRSIPDDKLTVIIKHLFDMVEDNEFCDRKSSVSTINYLRKLRKKLT